MSGERQKQYTHSSVSPSPEFDMELFMGLSQTERLDHETLEQMIKLFADWLPYLKAYKITVGGKSYLALWMDEEAEKAVDAAWEDSANYGFYANALAQTIVMAATADLMPEAVAAGCAPIPRPNAPLRACLRELGARWDENSALSRRYAMVTHMPYKGGCDVCFVKDTCPNAAMMRPRQKG